MAAMVRARRCFGGARVVIECVFAAIVGMRRPAGGVQYCSSEWANAAGGQSWPSCLAIFFVSGDKKRYGCRCESN
ncbi:hypothetical protein C6Q28_27690 [Burkholderia multivorans]|uniref:Uncharacterized protein n=1 Tax=Burkholderia multivorans TaxID=87883 RepID=A0A2S9M849_9BURK|nr:hypothetical protein CA831_10100 [Burkholderia multivorans]PRE00011.1 hypothetical protein C6P91_27250 [Burkholderia multivorans]PRE75494.1 hypothetical protein C6Q02_25950 [Burkholderia multivorans]PRF01142.1 hypothetical protein C6Q05_10555 [Burkholderia multivorans]PRF04417.1 hypothetical protein C6Q07_17945 [Burkholderia multivorans]